MSQMNLYSQLVTNDRGNTLIQVVIASGMMVVIGLGVMGMISNQNKEVGALSEKILVNELESQVKNMFSNNDYCACLLRGKTFNTTLGSEAIVAGDQLTQLPSGYSTGPLDATPCTVNSDNTIPISGTTLPNSKMIVGTVGIGNMKILSPANYKADVLVTFTNTVRALKGMKIGIQFAINPALNTITNRPFVSCTTPTSGGGGGTTGQRAIQFGLDPNIWPNYIACIRPGDLKFVLELSVMNPLDVDQTVYYVSPYVVNTTFPVIPPTMSFKGTDGAWKSNTVITNTAPCNQSIQALKAAGFTW